MAIAWATMDYSPSGVDFFTENPSDLCGIIKLSAEVLTFTTGFGRHRIPFYNERRRGGRAVECTGLENRQGCEPFVGSNPTLSAIFLLFKSDHNRHDLATVISVLSSLSLDRLVAGMALPFTMTAKSNLISYMCGCHSK